MMAASAAIAFATAADASTPPRFPKTSTTTTTTAAPTTTVVPLVIDAARRDTSPRHAAAGDADRAAAVRRPRRSRRARCRPTPAAAAASCTPSRGNGCGRSRPTARVSKTHRVSGRLTWNQPLPGTYSVFSRSMYTCNIKNPAICWRYMVRFAKGGDEGDNIGFHEIPKKNGVPVQTVAQLGTAVVRRLRPPGDIRRDLHVELGAGRHEGRRPRASDRRSYRRKALETDRYAGGLPWPRPAPRNPASNAAPGRNGSRSSWSCIAAFACFTAAGVIAGGQWVLSQRKLAPLARDHVRSARAPAQPDVVVPDPRPAPRPTTAARPRCRRCPASTVADAAARARRARCRQLPRRRCRQRRLRRRSADRGSQRSRRAQRHDHGVAGQPEDERARRAVVPTRPLRRVPEWPQEPHQRRLQARRSAASCRRCSTSTSASRSTTTSRSTSAPSAVWCNAVGGVEIPFQYPARDKPSNGNPPLFLVEQTGCVNLDGDTALAYVRSRHYQYEDPPGQRELGVRPHVRLRPHHTPAGFPATRAREGDRRRALRPRRGAGPDHRPTASTSSPIPTSRCAACSSSPTPSRTSIRPTVTTYRIDSTSHTTSDGAAGRDPRRSRATTCRRSWPSSAARRPWRVRLSRSSRSRPPRSPASARAPREATEDTGGASTASDSAEATPDHHAPDGRRRGEHVGVAPDRSNLCDVSWSEKAFDGTAGYRVAARPVGPKPREPRQRSRDPSTRQRRRAPKQETQ